MVIKLATDTRQKIKTVVYARGFNMNFVLTLYREKPVAIEYAEWWVKTQIIETARVRGVEWYLPTMKLYIGNEKFVEENNQSSIQNFINYVQPKKEEESESCEQSSEGAS